MKKTGDEYFDSKEFQELLATYENAVSSGQPVFMDAEELAEIADYYQLTGNLGNAEKAIQLAINLSPGAIAPLTYRIHESLFNGDIAAAENYFNQIIETDAPDYTYDYAEILLAKGLPDEANQYLKEQFKTIPPEEYQDYLMDVAAIFQDYGFNELSAQWIRKAKHEDSQEYKELMARVLYGMGKYKDSEKLFSELVDSYPFSKKYWNALASTQFMNEDYSHAIESSEYAIAIDPNDPDGILAKANGLYWMNNFEEAEKYYRRYLNIEEKDVYAMLHLGTCLVNNDKSQEAIGIFLKAIECAAPDSPYICDIYQELAFAYCEENNLDNALEWLDKTETLDCDHIHIKVIKGHVLLYNGRVEEAEAVFKDALQSSSQPLTTLLRIIISLYDNRYIRAAYTLLKKYFQIVPEDNKDGYAYMALCCWDLKQKEEFLKYLKIACERNPHECKVALSGIIPEEVEPQDYYNFIKEKMNILDKDK